MTDEVRAAPTPGAGTATFEAWASRLSAGLPQALRRVPFTATVVVVTLLVGLVTRGIWLPVWRASWFPDVAYGLPALREGKVWTLLTGPLLALTPGQYVTGVILFAVLVGACELRLGTKAVAVTAVAGQIGGVLLATLLVWALSETPWIWARHLAMVRDVGFTTGALTVVAVTSAALRSPWRLRVRAVLGFTVAVAVLFEGTLSDVAHAVVVGIGFLVGQRRYGVEPGFGPRTRRETRMLAFAGLIAIGLTEVVVLLAPGRGPLGTTAGAAAPAVDVLVDLAIIAVVTNALRLGKRWAWWATVGYGVLNLPRRCWHSCWSSSARCPAAHRSCSAARCSGPARWRCWCCTATPSGCRCAGASPAASRRPRATARRGRAPCSPRSVARRCRG